MSDEHAHDDEQQASWPEGIVMAQAPGVRVFWLTADDMQGLVDRLALVLSEHIGHPMTSCTSPTTRCKPAGKSTRQHADRSCAPPSKAGPS